MATLIAHHLQEAWDQVSSPKYAATCQSLSDSIVNYIHHQRRDVSRVIITMTDELELTGVGHTDRHGERSPLPEASHEIIQQYCESQGIEVLFKKYGEPLFRNPRDHEILESKLIANGAHKRLTYHQMSEINDLRGCAGDEILASLNETTIQRLNATDRSILLAHEPTFEQYPKEEKGVNWIDSPKGGERIVEVPQWVKELSREEVLVCGTSDSEASNDLKAALNSVNASIKDVPELMLGSEARYELTGANARVVAEDTAYKSEVLAMTLSELFHESRYEDPKMFFEGHDYRILAQNTNISRVVADLEVLQSTDCGLDLVRISRDNAFACTAFIKDAVVGILKGERPDFLKPTQSAGFENSFVAQMLSSADLAAKENKFEQAPKRNNTKGYTPKFKI